MVVCNAYALSDKGNLAEKLYLQGDYRTALYECERLLGKYRMSEFGNEVMYLAGLCSLKLNNINKAKEYFVSVLNSTTNRLLASEAHRGLDYISKKASKSKGPSLFSVQVGSFKHKRNAQRLYNRFKRRRYTVRIIEEKSGSVTVYKIKIGRFKSKKGALHFSKRLSKKGYPTAITPY